MSVAGTAALVGATGMVYWYFARDLPKIITVADYRPWGVTRVLGAADPLNAKSDPLLAEFYKERRYVVPYEKIPEVVVRAFISAEDDKFFEHMGINFSSMLRASIANFRAGHVVQGGSTITQQVAKSLLVRPERNLSRKIREAILASRIENNLTKQQILYLYLNQIYLGHGAYGVQAAARTYYQKDVSELTVAEAAVLAGLPQAPGKYSPIVNSKKAKERQLYVLRRMFENKFITQAQFTESAALPLRIFHDEDPGTKNAAYMVEHVRRYLLEKYGEKAIYEDGLTVYLPTNARLAQAAGKSLRDGLSAVDKRLGYRGPLQHLKTPEEVEKFLREDRLKLIDRKLHFQVMMPDGRMDAIEAMHLAGLTNDADLLVPGELYQAVVTGVDDKHKSVGVVIGTARAELPLEKMKWAKPLKDEKAPVPARGEPSLPSKVLMKGDVILVKLAEETPEEAKAAAAAKTPKPKPRDGILTVQLEQTPQIQGALVSIEANTGYVLAMEGGYSFDLSEFNRAVQAQRQPGSAFKPIIYSAGLEKGYTPATIIIDSPIVYEDLDSGKWKPSNFEEKFYGDTTFRQALIKSRNVPTIKIVQSIGVSKVIEYAKRIGINGSFNNDLSISLGSASISLLEMTKAYALFPRLGRQVNPIFFTKVVDRDGRVLEEQKAQMLPAVVTIQPPVEQEPQPTTSASPGPTTSIVMGKTGIPMPEYPLAKDPDQVQDPRVAYVMSHLMKEVVNYGTGHDAKALARSAAGKTGTTNEYIDAWFMGFTPHVVTGVWVGFDGQRPVGPGETGARAALPIWLSYMREAVKQYPDTDFTIPPGVVFASIDTATGKLAAPNSSQSIKEAFIEGTQPTETATQGVSTPESQSEFFKEDIE